MRIFLDQGIYDMRNMGQNALLQVAIERIRRLWPDASIGVTTFAPQLLKMYFPDVFPVSPDGTYGWYKNGNRSGRSRRLMPASVLKILLEIREQLWYRWPGFRPRSVEAKLKAWLLSASEGLESPEISSIPAGVSMGVAGPDYASLVSGADLFIATGSQYMCDHARDTAFQVLGRLEASIHQGIPTAMVGQGMGPIEDAELRIRAKEILPLVDLILVRERLEAPALLASLGVDPARVLVTGDDAIELAYKARSSELGSGIGISMRCMPSTKVGDADLPMINKILKEMAHKYEAELVGLPISMSIHERDDLYTKQLLSGYAKTWIGRRKFQTTLAFIKDIQRCRLMVTGTFHGAVLALAQGIPVICLVRSDLYANKFNGLVDLFGPGCKILSLDDERFQERLTSSLDSMWQSAEKFRVQLLESGVQQIEWGNAAYRQLFEMLNSKQKLEKTR